MHSLLDQISAVMHGWLRLICYTLSEDLLLTAVTDTFGGGATVVDMCTSPWPPVLRPNVLAVASKLWVAVLPVAITALWLRPRTTGVEFEVRSEPKVPDCWGCCPCQDDEMTEPWLDEGDTDVEPWCCDKEIEGLLCPGLDDRGGSSGGTCDVITLVPRAERWTENTL